MIRTVRELKRLFLTAVTEDATNTQPEVVEIKCQLDATEGFIADLIACSIFFEHHYAHHQELKSITQWLLPVVFRAVVLKLLVWCGAEGYVSGLQDAGKPASILQTGHITHRQQSLYNTLELLMKGIVVPETC